MAQQALPQELDLHLHLGPTLNPLKLATPSAKLMLSAAFRYDDSGFVGIGWAWELDPQLHDFYSRKLLEPGWAGDVSDTEAAYIARELTRRPRLRRLWQVARFTRRRKAITPAMAKKLARWWAEMPL